jgi:hypothetical protein
VAAAGPASWSCSPRQPPTKPEPPPTRIHDTGRIPRLAACPRPPADLHTAGPGWWHDTQPLRGDHRRPLHRRARGHRRVMPAKRRYTALHGRLLSLSRLSPLLQPAVRPQARQPVPQARPRPDRPNDGPVPARARRRGATVLEVGGGVGEIQIELLQAGAAQAQNLELSPAYEHEARSLAGQGSKGVSTGASRISPRTQGRWNRPTWWSCTGWCAVTQTMSACLQLPPTMGVPWSSAIHPGTRSPAPSTACSTW